jgi:hypothetical protein
MNNDQHLDEEEQSHISFLTDGISQKAHHSWYRGDTCNFTPTLANIVDERSAFDWVLKGWLPAEPVIGPKTRVIAFGSCFAGHITEYLRRLKFNILTAEEGEAAGAYVVRCGEGMVNTFAIRQQFEWAFHGTQPKTETWHNADAQVLAHNEEIRRQTKALFDAGDVFIITLGLSEIWYDAITGDVFWRAVPKEHFDPKRHKFRVSSVAENKDNLRQIYRLIKEHRADAKVIFTLSPIPLVATFRPVSCVSANAVSKSILRAALDEVMREIDEPRSLFYWPSYELITELFSERWTNDRRHIKQPILEFVMGLFQTYWCDAPLATDLKELWRVAEVAGRARSSPTTV